jgi:hypothetical protein
MTNNFALFILDKLHYKGGCNDIFGFALTFESAKEIATNIILNDNTKIVHILNYSTGTFSIINADKIHSDKSNEPKFLKVIRVRTINFNNKDYHQNVNHDNIFYNIGDNKELSICANCKEIKDRLLFLNHLFICDECMFH